MKLHILSDLHVEFTDFVRPTVPADVVVLAGDIGVGHGGIDWVQRNVDEVPVIYVPGNHEYYRQDISFREELGRESNDQVHILDDGMIQLDGVRFVGSTLWTDFALHGEKAKPLAIENARIGVNDFSSIRNGSRVFTPEDSIRLHEQSVAYLAELLAIPFDGPTVVVTHHLPSNRSIAPRFASHALNPTFASNLEHLMKVGQPRLWIHGHTHEACDYQFENTRVVCNPRGYPGEMQSAAFEPRLVVEVQ